MAFEESRFVVPRVAQVQAALLRPRASRATPPDRMECSTAPMTCCMTRQRYRAPPASGPAPLPRRPASVVQCRKMRKFAIPARAAVDHCAPSGAMLQPPPTFSSTSAYRSFKRNDSRPCPRRSSHAVPPPAAVAHNERTPRQAPGPYRERSSAESRVTDSTCPSWRCRATCGPERGGLPPQSSHSRSQPAGGIVCSLSRTSSCRHRRSAGASARPPAVSR